VRTFWRVSSITCHIEQSQASSPRANAARWLLSNETIDIEHTRDRVNPVLPLQQKKVDNCRHHANSQVKGGLAPTKPSCRYTNYYASNTNPEARREGAQLLKENRLILSEASTKAFTVKYRSSLAIWVIFFKG